MLFRKKSERSETRILTAVGVVTAVCLGAVFTGVFADPIGGRGDDQIGIVIESPYSGRGVRAGTPVLLHGVEVGEVTDVKTFPGGAVRVAADLQRGPAASLTNTIGIDFRPANYFGVTGVNLRPGDGGQPLTNGSRIVTTPAGNFTLQAMLSRLGEISHGVFTPQLIEVIEKTTTYTDSLDPLLETVVVVSDALTRVQTVSTAQLLRNTAGISVAFPGFLDATTRLGDGFQKPMRGYRQEWWDGIIGPTLKFVADSFFGAIGKVIGSHSVDLAPVTDMIKAFTDVVPGLVPPDAIADTARELRNRLERLFAGPPDRRAISVRVILDSLPGLQAPMAAMGAP
jgi:MlaD protein